MAIQEAALGKAGTRIVTVNSEDTDLRWIELASAINPAKIAADRAVLRDLLLTLIWASE